jgi:rare lipoprotein A
MYDSFMSSRRPDSWVQPLPSTKWMAWMLMAFCVAMFNQPAVAGDALEPRVEPITSRAPNRPYFVAGKQYEPLAADVPFRQRGKSSWYGVPFHGRKTANGETFNMHELTAAHPTLPIPSYVRVRLVGSDRSVIVRINDRGPFHGSRVIDLSYAAANRLGMLGRGTAEVDIERLTFDDIRTGRWRQSDEPVLVQSPNHASPEPGTTLGSDPVMALIEMMPESGASAATSAGQAAASVDAISTVINDPVLPVAEASSAPESTIQSPYWVQLAAFDHDTGAVEFRRRIQHVLGELASSLAVQKEGSRTRLQLGPYSGPAEAAMVARRVRNLLQLSPMIVQRL